ncbi:hypothetical protein ACIQUQ_23950 [Streptomyces sp. NPDC101118]|uniref:hypothetical protein n=1 Tax=Streptomyces sp. NPDC101118 TaxID=3366109 RepID=UPI00380B30E2
MSEREHVADGEAGEPTEAAEAGPPLVREVHPDLVAELVALLEAEGERDLAVCVRDVRLYERCPCTDDFCQSFRTAPGPDGPYGPGHRCLPLLAEQGMLNLDVVQGRIVYVEVIDHAPLRDHRLPADPDGAGSSGLG